MAPSAQPSPSQQTPTPATPSTPSLSPGERLAERVQTIDDAVQVVEHEVKRAELFRKLRDSGVLALVNVPDPQRGDPIPAHASNTFVPDKFKNIDLRGVDASLIQFVDANGNPKPLAEFVLGLTDEEAKELFQGTVYDKDTQLSSDPVENTKVHTFLQNISSDYRSTSSLTEVKALVEPASTRCAALLSQGAATGNAATPAAAAASGTGLPTPPNAPPATVWQITAPSSSPTPANTAPSVATGAATAPAGTSSTGTPIAGQAPSSHIRNPNSASAMGGNGTKPGTAKQVMADLAREGDEDAQVKWFIAQRIAEERLKVIKSLNDIVIDPASSSKERGEAENKAVTLVQGWLRDTGNSVVKNVVLVRAPSNVSTNPASAGSGAAAAGSPPERLLMGLPRLFERLCSARPSSEWGDASEEFLEWPGFDEAVEELALSAGFKRIDLNSTAGTGAPAANGSASATPAAAAAAATPAEPATPAAATTQAASSAPTPTAPIATPTTATAPTNAETTGPEEPQDSTVLSGGNNPTSREVATAEKAFAELLPNVALALNGDIFQSLPGDSLAARADLQDVFEERSTNISDKCLNEERVEFICELREKFLRACSPVEELLKLGGREQYGDEDASVRQRIAQDCSTLLGVVSESIQNATCLDDYDREQLMMAVEHVDKVLEYIRETHVPNTSENSVASANGETNISRRQTAPVRLRDCSIPEELRRGLDYGFVSQSFPDKGYCFVQTSKGKVFVHVSDGSFLELDERNSTTSFVGDRYASVPEVGEEIFLSIEKVDKGLRAGMWCTAEGLNPRPRPTPLPPVPRAPGREETQYRVMQQFRTPMGQWDEPSAKWTGRGIEALQRRFPTGRNDELRPFSNGDLESISWIEKKNEDGQWVEISDPRT